MPMVSRYFQGIAYDENCSIIWHSVFGRPMLVTKDLARTLSRHSMNRNQFTLEDLFGAEYSKDEAVTNTIKDLVNSRILLIQRDTKIGYDEQESESIYDLFLKHNPPKKNKVKNLSLIMSEECPFRCKYCIHFANSKHQFNPEKMMPLEVAKSAIDGYFKIVKVNGLNEAYINFGGGEPLLNWRTIKELLPYIHKHRQKLGIPIKMGINTNLALLTKDIAKALIKYDVEIAASLDGTKSGNDAVRLSKNLSGTYDQIMRGFDIMYELGHPLDGFAMTVTADNFFDVDKPIIDWAAARGMKEVRIDIDVVGTVNLPIKKIVSRLARVRRYAKSEGISVIGFWSRPAENMGLIPENEDVGFCGGERGNSLCVAPSGQVFPCGYSNYDLGSYTEIPTIHKKPQYSNLLSQRNLLKLSSCKDCPILGFCRGGCMITKEANHGSSEKLSRMCELYLAMTYEILRESVEE